MTDEIKEHQDRAIDDMSIGMVFAAKKLKRFYDILSAVGLPDDIIKIELTAWCQGESRVQVEPMIHAYMIQQRQAYEEPKS